MNRDGVAIDLMLGKLAEEGYMVHVSKSYRYDEEGKRYTLHVTIYHLGVKISSAFGHSFADALEDAYMDTLHASDLQPEDQRLRCASAPTLPGMEE